jgi:hypothetical protein
MTCVWTEDPELMGLTVAAKTVLIGIDDQLEAQLLCDGVAEGDLSRNFHFVSIASRKGIGEG